MARLPKRTTGSIQTAHANQIAQERKCPYAGNYTACDRMDHPQKYLRFNRFILTYNLSIR